MSATKIIDNVYWVGAVDWSVRTFHGHTYTTDKGTTYNAYLIIDDKVTLVDCVHSSFSKELIENIKEIIDPSKIDYIISNHVEPDHSGAIVDILKLAPKAKVFGTAKCKDGLYKYYYIDMDFQVVKTGDTLCLGKKTLQFIEAPMLHWPDSMFTYMIEDQILMPNDAFGQHIATSSRFDDEINQCDLSQEALKYYANILWPLSQLVLKKIEDIQKSKLPIKIIAPSHGIIWRRDPSKIIDLYVQWAKNTTKNKVIIFYETMWKSTEKMAKKIIEGLQSYNIEVKCYNIAETDQSNVISDMLDAKGFLIGSSTHDNDMLPNIAGFLEYLIGLKPQGRIAAVFGSYGWAGGAVKKIENKIKESTIQLSQPGIQIRFVPDENELKNCYNFGCDFAKKILS